ncbi:hypothetical protein PUN28_008505 [Cardiocondyla obscurior]|uniref:Uncharacterized protein n=1 Tax=Cardiocondyla obscurior TaxID=286306 RepID=A0AAW2G147_9HYME
MTSLSERRSRPRRGILLRPDNVVNHRSVLIADVNEKRTVGGSSAAFNSREQAWERHPALAEHLYGIEAINLCCCASNW